MHCGVCFTWYVNVKYPLPVLHDLAHQSICNAHAGCAENVRLRMRRLEVVTLAANQLRLTVVGVLVSI